MRTSVYNSEDEGTRSKSIPSTRTGISRLPSSIAFWSRQFLSAYRVKSGSPVFDELPFFCMEENTGTGIMGSPCCTGKCYERPVIHFYHIS